MCYNLVVVRDLLSWLWKLGECDVSPLRVSEALNIWPILEHTAEQGLLFLSLSWTGYTICMSLSYKKEPKTEVKVVILNKDSVFLGGF